MNAWVYLEVNSKFWVLKLLLHTFAIYGTVQMSRGAMLVNVNQDVGHRHFFYNVRGGLLMLLCACICLGQSLYADAASDEEQNLQSKVPNFTQASAQTITYYLYISDFANSFIQIPTSNVAVDSSTISSTYLAGRAAVYNQDNLKVGTCSASFLCMQNQDGIYTDISNFISVDSGLVVYWLTPTTLINLELDSIIHSMVTECMVTASTKIGFNPFYGQTFNLVVSSDDAKIYFKFTRTGTIF